MPAEVQQEPYKLPAGFEWCEIDIADQAQMTELYELLSNHYVEDDDNMFRFDYSREFLSWALTPPGWLRLWHAGVRATANQKLLAFISAIPALISINGLAVRNVEINFLCAHKKLRAKRLAPVLIKEITRRVHLQGIAQAVYTAGVRLPRPLAKAQYYHRSLNPKKLVEVGFSYMRKNSTMKRLVKLYAVPEAPLLPGLRPMVPADVPQCNALLRSYLAKTAVFPHLSDEEFAHWILPRPGLVCSYVIEQADGSIQDMLSFYQLNSTVIGNTKYPTLRAAYSYYNVATTVPLKSLMFDALIIAKAQECDVFNALDVMDNASFLRDLSFGPGDGSLHFYCYNWKCAQVPPNKVGLVLL